MKPDLLPLLCSPVTHETLELVTEPDTDGVSKDYLVSTRSGKKYLIREGIPIFLDQSEISGLNKKYQTLYDRLARFYDIPYRIGYTMSKKTYTQRITETWIGELEIHDGDKVLEVSIGTGFNYRLLPRNASYIGLDLTWGMLKQCQRNFKRWGLEENLLQGQAEQLPFRNEVFDVVFHVGGINFFNDKARAIEEMIRVAKPGTKIVIVDENEEFFKFYEKIPLVRGAVKDREPVSAPVDLVPANMLDRKSENKWKGNFYCLSFRKPR